MRFRLCRRPLSRFVAALCAFATALPLTLVPAPARAQLPTLGDTNELSIAAERQLGERIAREIYRDPDYFEDPLLSEYLQGIWVRLLAASRIRGELTPEIDERFAWQILLIRDRSVNAFALPGGYLGVNLGLIGVVSSRDEIASVLAHEMSHVTQRHIARMMTQQGKQMPWLIAAMVIGALAGVRGAGDGANAAIVGSQALAIQNQLSFSRDMEREADRIGYSVMTQAGFQPQGFVTMFEKLEQAARLNDNGSYPYLRSHPMTSERIADMQLRQRLEERSAAPVPLVMDHAMLSARARLLANPGVDVLRAAMARAFATGGPPVNAARQAGDLYAAALAAMRLREFAPAREILQRLALLTAADPAAARIVRLLGVETDLAAGDAAAAIDKLGPVVQTRPELLLAAQAYGAAGRGAELTGPLQSWLVDHPRDPAAWQALGGAWAAQGSRLRALRAEAEAQVAKLDYAAAVDRLKAAQDIVRRGEAGRSASDYIDASIIDARMREVDSLLREQRLER